MVKRILVVIMFCLVIALSSSAFGQMIMKQGGMNQGGINQEVILPKGSGYLEKEIGGASGVKVAGSVNLNSQNQLVVCDLGSKTPRYVILSNTGKPVGEIKGDFSGNGDVFTLDGKDNLYVLAQNISLGPDKRVTAIERAIYVYATTGSARGKLLKQITLGKVSGDKAEPVSDLVVDSQGNLYLLAGSRIGIFDKDGQSKRDLEFNEERINFIDCDEKDNLVMAGMAMGKGPGEFLKKLNPLTGQVIWKQNISLGGGLFCGRYSRADHCTYLVNSDSVLQFDPQGRQLGSLLDLKQYRVLGFDMMISNINVVKGAKYPTLYLTNVNQQLRSFFLESQPAPVSGKSYHIYQYTFTNKLPAPKNQKTITISTLMEDRFLQTAISAFQSKYPDIKIELKSFVSGNLINKTDMERFAKTVNTDLMAGKGSDIIALGFGPFQKLADRNTLVDLSELMAKDKSFNRGDYFTNLLDASKYKGKLYALPIFIQFEALQANQAMIDKVGIEIDDSKWSWDDFVKIAEKVAADSNGDGAPDQFALPNMDRQRLFNWMFRSYFSSFVDLEKKQASLDSAEFIRLLNRCQSFSDKQLMNPQADPNAGFVKIQIINGQRVDKSATSVVAFTPTTVFDYNSVLGAKMTFNSGRILALPTNGEGGGFETPFGMLLGINRKSKVQKEAWEFLKFLVSVEAQSAEGKGVGLPINREGLQKRVEQEIAREKAQGIKDPLRKEDLAQVEAMIGNLRQFNSIIDPQLISIIDDELGPFFSGQKTAAEVAKLIQSKVMTYLQE